MIERIEKTLNNETATFCSSHFIALIISAFWMLVLIMGRTAVYDFFRKELGDQFTEPVQTDWVFYGMLFVPVIISAIAAVRLIEESQSNAGSGKSGAS